MLSTSFVCYGCSDIVNDQRTYKYLQWAKTQGLFPDNCCPSDILNCGCDDDEPEPFIDPVTDNVCWYDPEIPESNGFLGLVITRMIGLGSSTYSRNVTDNSRFGSNIGLEAIAGKSIIFEGYLLATNCDSIEYGFQYMKSQLETPVCNPSSCGNSTGSCGTRNLIVRNFCPENMLSDDSGLREFINAGVVDGLEELPEQDASTHCCCVMREVTFTIQTDREHSFTPFEIAPIVLDEDADDSDPACFDFESCCATDPSVGRYCYDWGTCSAIPCNCSNCEFDHLCPNQGVSLIRKKPLVRESCFCEPMETTRNCFCDADLPNHLKTTYQIIIDSGFDSSSNFSELGLRNVRLRIWDNPLGLPCPDASPADKEYWDCQNPCFSLDIPYIPQSSSLVIDGRSESITLNCKGQCVDWSDRVTGINASRIVWPLDASCRGKAFCVEWDYDNTSYNTIAGVAKPSHVTIRQFRKYK